MTITIETPADVEEVITRVAVRHGVTPEEYVLRAAIEKARAEALVLDSEEKDTPRKFPPGATWNGIPIEGNSLVALFAQWEADDPVLSEEDREQRTREGREITAAIEANRLSIPRDPELVAIIERVDEEAVVVRKRK